jgi:TolB-like protein
VVERNTAFGLKGKAVDIADMGAELKVGYAVEGTVHWTLLSSYISEKMCKNDE